MKKERCGVKKCLEICAVGGGGGVGRLMANVVLNFQFNIFCILPLVEEYKVDLFAFFCVGIILYSHHHRHFVFVTLWLF